MTETIIETPLRLFHPYHKEKHLAAERGDYLNSIITVEVSPTGACNQNCIFCLTDEVGVIKTSANDYFIKKERVKTLVDELVKLKVKGVYPSSIGDPLCNKKITFYFIDLLSEKKIDTTLITNGVALEDEDIPKLLKVYALRITLNSGKITYKDVNNLDNNDSLAHYQPILKKIKKVAKLKTQGIGNCRFFGANYVVTPKNINELLKVYKTLSSIKGLDGLIIKIAFANKKITWTEELFEMAKKVINETIEKSRNEKGDFFVELYHPDRLSSLEHTIRKCPVNDFGGCSLLKHRLFIDNEGRILMCAHQNPEVNPEAILGDLKKNSLPEIVKSISEEKINRWGKYNKFCFKGCAYHDRNLEIQRIKNELKNKGSAKIKHFSKSKLDDILVNFM